MISVDDREGSRQLGEFLKRRKQPVDLCRMEFGDIAFIGMGPEGRPIPIGIEYKKVGDALSCITDGRFAGHQLIGLAANYELCMLLIEGATRPTAEGLLEIQHERGFWYKGKSGPRAFMYRELANWLSTMQFKAGMRVIRTSSLAESAAVVTAMYGWWTAGWESHNSHLAMHAPVEMETVSLVKPSLARLVASCLPGIGTKRSADVARKFPTVFEMVMAGEADWREIEGIGKDTAAKVVSAINNWKGNGK